MSAAERFLTFLLWELKMSDLEDLEGRGRAAVEGIADFEVVEEEIRADRLLEKLRDVVVDIGLCFVFEGSFTPYRDSDILVDLLGSTQMEGLLTERRSCAVQKYKWI